MNLSAHPQPRFLLCRRQSFIQLVQRNRTSNEKILLYVSSKIAATREYSKGLYSIRDVVIGGKPGSTAAAREEERKASKIERAQKRNSRATSTLASGGARPFRQSPLRPKHNMTALEHMFWMEETQGAMLADMCDDLEAEVADGILARMNQDLNEKFEAMVAKGNACVKILEAHEAAAVAAFADYVKVLGEEKKVTSMKSATPTLPQRGGLVPPPPPILESSHDCWLADCNYSVAVSQLLAAYESASKEMARLFGEMKDLEVNRRCAIQGALQTVVQMHDDVLRELPTLRDPVLVMLNQINTDRRALDAEVREAMRTGAAKIRKGGSEGGKSGGKKGETKIEEAEKKQDVVLPPTSMEGFAAQLKSPLGSPLLLLHMLAERRYDGLVTRWTPSLLVVTRNRHLHIFDLPSKSKATQGGVLTADTAFRSVVPELNIVEVVTAAGKGKALRTPGPEPVPVSISLDLRCSCADGSAKDTGKGAGTIEILELTRTMGVRSMLRSYDRRKVTLRGDVAEMRKLAHVVNEIGREGMAVLRSEGVAV
jgi:hypothetical protein